MRTSIIWSAAVCAGIAAGIAATGAQIVLWWAFTDALPWIVYRDARLTAAIVMGRGVLSPPVTFDWDVMLIATLIHFALSIAYGIVLACFISRLGVTLSLAVGALYGLVLYVINMHGFTIIFPWFSEVRDWITIVTHAVFGVVIAGAYKVLRPGS